ncbi:hypothetical protein GCM10012275_11030 [Longimycelium tulufanense]|uniref:Restriction endonuclease type IV Mrr domain-containing protein n=1 Tax=Longimycelium tulufanense TaxID=907463 RepID=A0A8J3FTM3_9PSEU|nr:restriction endonuclease [Longimycelium tulufanense]GGM41849.1 hypothetical protein GCM10012275_11030 [Longimycelium tulufanense]
MTAAEVTGAWGMRPVVPAVRRGTATATSRSVRSSRRRARAERQELAARLTTRLAAREAALAELWPDPPPHPAAGLDLLVHPVGPGTFDPGPLAEPLPPPRWSDFAQRCRGGVLGWLVSGAMRVERELANQRFARAQADHAAAERRRRVALAAARRAHTEHALLLRQQFNGQHPGLRRLTEQLAARDPDTVQDYFARVLRYAAWPRGIPCRPIAVRYLQPARRLFVRWPLPSRHVVPAVARYRPDRSQRGVTAVPRRESEVARRYAELVAAVPLRVVHELFGADFAGALTDVVVNGEIENRNSLTGRIEHVRLVSLAVSRSEFDSPRTHSTVDWLRTVGGRMSPDPYRGLGVTPVVDFEGFIPVPSKGPRTDVRQLPPEIFARLVRRLLLATGLHGWTTRYAGMDRVEATGELPGRDGSRRCLIVVRRDAGVTAAEALDPVLGTVAEVGVDQALLATTAWFPLALHRRAAADARVRLVEGHTLRNLALRHLGISLVGLPVD